jgi:hypothetical protein
MLCFAYLSLSEDEASKCIAEQNITIHKVSLTGPTVWENLQKSILRGWLEYCGKVPDDKIDSEVDGAKSDAKTDDTVKYFKQVIGHRKERPDILPVVVLDGLNDLRQLGNEHIVRLLQEAAKQPRPEYCVVAVSRFSVQWDDVWSAAPLFEWRWAVNPYERQIVLLDEHDARGLIEKRFEVDAKKVLEIFRVAGCHPQYITTLYEECGSLKRVNQPDGAVQKAIKNWKAKYDTAKLRGLEDFESDRKKEDLLPSAIAGDILRDVVRAQETGHRKPTERWLLRRHEQPKWLDILVYKAFILKEVSENQITYSVPSKLDRDFFVPVPSILDALLHPQDPEAVGCGVLSIFVILALLVFLVLYLCSGGNLEGAVVGIPLVFIVIGLVLWLIIWFFWFRDHLRSRQTD